MLFADGVSRIFVNLKLLVEIKKLENSKRVEVAYDKFFFSIVIPSV